MAKIERPLFGDLAGGSIAGLLTFRTRGGKAETMQQRKSTRDPSAEQELNRTRFATAHAEWMLLPKQQIYINKRYYWRRIPDWPTFYRAWPAPAAPSNLTATATSESAINLAWTDNSDNEDGFKVERKTGTGGTWTLIATPAANVTTYHNTNLTQGTAYYYRVRASNVVGDSEFTNEAHDTTWIPTAPTAPSGLTATATSASQINLTWTDNSTNETGFKVERKTGAGGSWAEIATTAANATAYSNTGLSQGTEYYYRVRAYNGIGDSDYTSEASATTQTVTCIFPIAEGETLAGSWISACASTHRSGRYAKYYTFTLTTTGVGVFNLTATEDAYLYLLNGAGTGGTVIAEDDDGGGGTNSRITKTLAAGDYTLEATTFTAGKTGNFTISAAISTAPPTAPSGLTATATSASQINLTWTDNSTNEEGFKIERKTGSSGTWAEIATAAANATAYSSTGLAQGTEYYYRVRAYNGIGDSDYTSEASATTQTVTCIFPIAEGETLAGSWISACASTHRSGKYARFYTFTLTATKTVTIDLVSTTDAYVYLLSGTGTGGTVITEDDDGGGGTNSRITRSLTAGSYTIEATTYSSGATGSFTVKLATA